jgi:integrase
MPRPATGQVIVEKRRRSPTFAVRFVAYGRRRYMRLGTADEGWTEARARTELDNVLADVRRGIWLPPVEDSSPEPPREIPTFHEFASEWFARQKVEGGRRGRGLSPASVATLEWVLSRHLLPVFADRRLDEISVEHVDRYRLQKVREGRLAPSSVNKTISTLGAVLEDAVEYELVDRNPASGRRRRLKAVKPERSFIDRTDHIAAMLDAGRELDDGARACRGQRRALLATLVFSGLRIGEALGLRWRDVDLARGTITVREAKTDAGVRTVDLLPVLRDELDGYHARLDPTPDAIVFATSTGKPHSQTNVRKRVLRRAIAVANDRLPDGAERLPDGLTPHSLRRTFASILFALGENPPYVMAQMGHSTAALTLTIYARQMDRRDGEPERLEALVHGGCSGDKAFQPPAPRDQAVGDRLPAGRPGTVNRTSFPSVSGDEQPTTKGSDNAEQR